MIRRLTPKVDIRNVDGRYNLRWGIYLLDGLTFEESEIALDQINARTFDPSRWKGCRSRISFTREEKPARGLGGHAA